MRLRLVMLAGAVLIGACSPAPSGSPTATPGAAATPGSSPAASAAPTGAGQHAAPSASVGTSGAVVIPLSGEAPDAIQIDGRTAWVLGGESGTLMEVDLAAEAEVRSIDVGFGATHLGLPAPGVASVARFDSTGGDFLSLVDLAAGSVDPLADVATGALGGMTVGEDAGVWALEQADRLVLVNASTRREVNDGAVDVGENVHMEVQWGDGSAWVGSDATPLLRVGSDDLAVMATIDVRGVPFVFRDGLLWGAGPNELWAIDVATDKIARRISLANVIEVLALDIQGRYAWIGVRRPGHVGRVLRFDLAAERVIEEHDVSLPAAVRIDGDRAWVASYLTNELIGFVR